MSRTDTDAKTARARSIAKNTFTLTSAQLMSQVLGVAWTFVLARVLGVTLFGTLTLATSVTGLVGILADPGITTIGVRDVSRKSAGVAQYLSNTLLLRLLLSFLVLGIVVGISLLYQDATVRVALILLGIGLLFDSGRAAAVVVFRAFQHLEFEALLILVFRIVSIAAGAAALLAGWSVLGVILGSVAASAVAAAMVFPLLASLSIRPSIRGLDLRAMATILGAAAPLGIGLVLTIIYFRIDVVLLSRLSTLEQVGLYGLAYKVIDSLRQAQTPFVLALFPIFSKMSAQSNRGVFSLAGRGLAISVSAAVGFAIVAAGFGSPVLLALAGRNFASTEPMLQFLVWALVCMFANNVLGYLVVARGLARAIAINAAMAVVVNVGVNLMLIPRFGGTGAAAATLITEAALLVANYAWLARTGGQMRPLAGKALFIVLVGLVLWLAVVESGEFRLLATAGAVLALVCSIFATRIVTPTDIRVAVSALAFTGRKLRS